MSLYEIPLETIDGESANLADHKGKALLIVNVASKCGFTPHYEGLQRLHETYSARGFTVLGFPCNQFGGQEPGSHEEIVDFCSTTYGVSFPLYAKVEVKGEGRHPLWEHLSRTPDAEGKDGDVHWNFEKFVVAPDGTVTARFRTLTTPEDPALVSAIESVLPTA